MKIKLKFILFFVPLLSVLLLALSLLNVFIFYKDKIAYVFSTTLENTQTASMMIKSELDSQKPLFDVLVSSFDFAKQKFPPESRNFLQLNSSLQYVQVDGFSRRNWETIDRLGEFPVDIKDEMQSARADGPMTALFFEKRKDLWGILYSFKMKSYTPAHYRVTVIYKRNPVYEILSKPRYFDLFLTNKKGQILSQSNDLADSNSALVIKAQSENIVQESPTTKEIEYNNNEVKENYLVAWVPITDMNLGFMSVVSRDKAVAAIKNMQRNALGFLCILLAIGLAGVLLLIRSLTNNIESLTKSMAEFSDGNLQVKSPVVSTDEVGTMSKVFNMMTDKITQLVAKESENARMETELETARNVQQRFVPSADYKSKSFSINGLFEPASECGGDWWYYIDKGDTCWLLIADVTGHGVASALMTAALRAGVAATQNIPNLSVADFVENLNRVTHDSGQGELMATFFGARVNLQTGDLTYVNASHCAPMLITPAGEEDGGIEFLDFIGGPRLGESPDSKYEERTIKIKPKDILFAYTDGLSEFTNTEGRMFGEKRIYKLLNKANSGKSVKAEQLRSQILGDFKNFQGSSLLDDDLTFFFFQFSQIEQKSHSPSPPVASP